MRLALTLLLLATPAVAQTPAATDPAPVTGELLKFQGFWKPESVTYEGIEQIQKDHQRAMMTLVIKRNEYRMYVVADAAKDEYYRLFTAELTLLADGRSFDFVVKTSKDGVQKRHGIYEFRDGKMHLTYCDAAKPRPTTFTAAAGSEQFVEVWQPEKR